MFTGHMIINYCFLFFFKFMACLYENVTASENSVSRSPIGSFCLYLTEDRPCGAISDFAPFTYLTPNSV